MATNRSEEIEEVFFNVNVFLCFNANLITNKHSNIQKYYLNLNEVFSVSKCNVLL